MNNGQYRHAYFLGFVQEYLVSLIAGVSCWIILQKILEVRSLPEVYAHSIKDGIALVFSALLALCLKLWSVRREIQLMLKQIQHTDPALREPLAAIMRQQLEDIGRLRDRLVLTGETMSQKGLEALTQACFQANGHRSYIGLDSHVPSVYMQLFPTYIQEQTLRSHRSEDSHDVRILLASEQSLLRDLKEHPDRFAQFYDLHLQSGFRLLQVDYEIAKRAAENLALPSTDIGIFGGTYAAFFLPHLVAELRIDAELGRGTAEAGQVPEPMSTSGRYNVLIRPIDERLRMLLRQLLQELNRVGRQIRLDRSGLTCVERDEEARRGDLDRLLWNLR
jgi:hypothetical protein